MISQVTKLKCMNFVEQVLHVPGNYSGGILEMAIIFDSALDRNTAAALTGDLIKALKAHSPVFRNVRLNTIIWKNEKEMVKSVTPMPILQMGRFFEDWETIMEVKPVDELARQLQLFYARSKLIFLLTNGDFFIEHVDNIASYMKPFLEKKLVILTTDKEDTALKLTRRTLLVPPEMIG